MIEPELLDEYVANAVRWAVAKKGSRDYIFKCLAFVEDAFEQSNDIEMFGGSTATESAEEYGVCAQGTPPIGAFVFYSATGPIDGITKDWGHVGLCIAAEQVIHAWESIRIDDYRELHNLPQAPGWNSPRYLGWTSPQIFLKGYRLLKQP